MSGFPSYAHTAAGVHQARVPHLVGAPCGTTAFAGPHGLMPVLVPAVVPLVPSNKANEPSLHGAAFPTKPTLRIQASGVHDEARSRAGRSVGCRHACLPNRSTWTDHAGYSGGRSLRSAQLSNAGGSADTEEVTGSNPVSPTSNTPGQMPIWPQRSPRRASHVQDSDRGAHLVGNQKEPALGAPAGPGNPTCLTRSPSSSSRPTRLRPSSWSDGRPNGESTGPIHANSGLQ